LKDLGEQNRRPFGKNGRPFGHFEFLIINFITFIRRCGKSEPFVRNMVAVCAAIQTLSAHSVFAVTFSKQRSDAKTPAARNGIVLLMFRRIRQGGKPVGFNTLPKRNGELQWKCVRKLEWQLEIPQCPLPLLVKRLQIGQEEVFRVNEENGLVSKEGLVRSRHPSSQSHMRND
jgi:hypothetical protein